MKTNNALCELLGIQYPIIQGAMAWVSEHKLAAAVSEAGGLGIIAGGNAPADIVREEIKQCKKLTDKPFAVNVMLLSPFADEVIDVICEEGVKIITTGAGSPAKYMEKLKQHNVIVIPVVPSVAIAKKMESLGVDAVVVEGMEAGGHIGKLTTMSLLPQVVDALNIPVVGAGGIADGRGMAAAFCLGADGVQVGTKFIVAKECTVHQNYKDVILKARDVDTVITGESTGHPVRVIKNKMARQFLKLEKEELKKESPDIDKIEAAGAGALRMAVVDGDVKMGSVMSGQVAGLVNEEASAKQIIETMYNEFQKLLGK